MKKERTHQQRAASFNSAYAFAQAVTVFTNFVFRNTPHPMRSGNDSQRTICLVARIQVKPN